MMDRIHPVFSVLFVLLNEFFHYKGLAVFDVVVLEGFEFCSVGSEAEYFGHADEGCCVPDAYMPTGATKNAIS